MAEDIAEQVNATEASVTDKLNQALFEAERNHWTEVLILAETEDGQMVRLLTPMGQGVAYMLSGWSYEMERAALLEGNMPHRDEV